MSILGKVLAVLNLFAAVGFVYLAATDWGKRQSFSYATYRHDLAIDGLPLDEKETDTQGRRLVDDLTDGTLRPIFSAVNAKPQPTQDKEIQRLRIDLKNDIAKEKPEDQRKLLARMLGSLARTPGERDKLIQQANTEPMDQLLGRDGPIEKAFTEALSKKDADVDGRRQAFAHLLYSFHVDETAEARVIAVVGWKAYGVEISRQTEMLQACAEQRRTMSAQDLAVFEDDHRRIIQELSLLDDQLRGRRAALLDQQSEKAKHIVLVASREEDVKELDKQIADAKKRVQQAQSKRDSETKLISDTQHNLDSTAGENQKLERKLRTLERVER